MGQAAPHRRSGRGSLGTLAQPYREGEEGERLKSAWTVNGKGTSDRDGYGAQALYAAYPRNRTQTMAPASRAFSAVLSVQLSAITWMVVLSSPSIPERIFATVAAMLSSSLCAGMTMATCPAARSVVFRAPNSR